MPHVFTFTSDSSLRWFQRLRQELVNFEVAKHYIDDYYSVDKYIHKIDGNSDFFHKKWQTFDGLMEI